MVEGHSVHRVAASHRNRLVGKKFTATSPNGRFADGAKAIDNQPFQRIEAIGKNLFAFFGPIHGPLFVVHVHFGMSGQWSVFDSTMEELGDEEFYQEKKAALGQDPLRADADVDLLFEKISNSKKTIGQLLMDQSVFAGPGNIYRAEILFKAGVHPNVKGAVLGRDRFEAVWKHTVALLRRGFECGSILTVDPEEAKVLGKPRLRRYIYNSAHCGRCGGRVVSWEVDSRTCYACPSCQPAQDNAAEPKTQPSKVFVSHCAREPLADRLQQGPTKLLVKELREELGRLGLDTKGTKTVLVQRLTTALAESSAVPQPERMEMVLSAEDAALEKVLAGENRAVEHVAELHPSQAAKVARAAGSRTTLRGGGKTKRDDVEGVEERGETDIAATLGAKRRKIRRTSSQQSAGKPQAGGADQ